MARCTQIVSSMKIQELIEEIKTIKMLIACEESPMALANLNIALLAAQDSLINALIKEIQYANAA